MRIYDIFTPEITDIINTVTSNDFYNLDYGWSSAPNFVEPMTNTLNYLTYTVPYGLDVKIDKMDVKITAEVPGVRSEDVEIDIDRKNLTIKAKKSVGDARIYEFSYAFQFLVDPDSASAHLECGILEILVQKHQKDAPRRLELVPTQQAIEK